MSAKTILITDDEPHMRRLLEFTVKKTGHRILQADSGEAALRLVDQEHVDLLIIDYSMEGLNGLETITTLRKLDAGAALPVILITARGDTGIKEEAQAAGISAFITKPFSPIELTRLVNELLSAG